MTIFSELSTGILLARRARYLSTGFWLLVTVITLALMAAQFSGRQPATVALDVGISAMRLLLPLLIILLAQELLTREFDRRYYLTSLSYPRPRHKLLLGRFVTILLLVYAVFIIIAITLGLVTQYVSLGYEQSTLPDTGANYLLTMAFIAIDLFVLTALAGLLAVVASTPSFVLFGTLGFMLVARSYSNVIALLERDQYLFTNTETYQHSLGVLGYLFPDLGALDVRTISLYSKMELLPTDWLANSISSIAYGLALVFISLILLRRKRFS